MMATKIRLSTLDMEEPLDVCDHISIPNAYEEDDHSEYINLLHIYCSECDETYEFDVLVN